jgi:23S rRNA (cytidine1920-2'-O)/16S rRNA (cytidine1409-2'-O)-methyltransferase
MDVSFISATYIIPQFPSLMAESAEAVCLVKPQFEVGRAMIGKGGIVRDKAAHADAIKRVCTCAASVGLSPVALISSPIEGGDGNREFLLHLVRADAPKVLTDKRILEVTMK